ncbi:rhamnan synthesis F family protein [Pseudomonas luteola]|uniref:rhamnan synthesis F family protein n=1 Tax=Pseudomonas luteola TaxID=47886 RepID=UPI0015E391B5|nr:rhamnan synthesis F family protein [Pseudomonas zeshuii]MBA1248916.1 sulfotransferase family 2 domain-containing protein [Pseudomonas zeshuii]
MSKQNNLSIFNDKNLTEYLKWNSYLSEKHKLLYIATPKAACTSLKWWFATLEGYSKKLNEKIESSESDPELSIHDTFYKVAPNVTGLSAQDLSEPLLSDSYFRFAVVRNPYKRIFSAWQSKLLLREPLQISPYLKYDFFYRPIKELNDISIAFEEFLEHLINNEAPSYWDYHWTPQADLLRPDLINYSKLVRIEDREELNKALIKRLGEYAPSPFSGRRTNESLIPYLPEIITDRASELICKLYAKDFDIFGYDTHPPKASEKFSEEQFDLTLKAIKLIRGRHQKLAERNDQIVHLREVVNFKTEEAIKLSQAVVARDGQITELSQAVIDRDSKVAELSQAVVARDGQITELSQAVIDRDSKVAELTSKLETIAMSKSSDTSESLKELFNRLTDIELKYFSGKDAQSSHQPNLELQKNKIDALAITKQVMLEENNEHEIKITILNEKISYLENQNKVLEDELAKKNHDLEYCKSLNNEKEITINSILSSRSWRLMSKPRAIVTMLKGLRRKEPLSSQDVADRAQAKFETVTQLPAIPSEIDYKNLGFDPDFYGLIYPDVSGPAEALYHHYLNHGINEGRAPQSKPLSVNKLLTDEGKPFVIVVCHEASRTGAPVLGWNICVELKRKYNVIAILLGDGELVSYFQESCSVVAGPYSVHERQKLALDYAINNIINAYAPKFAIVNSLASSSILKPLAENYIPSILLVHEFYKFHCSPCELVDTFAWAGKVIFSAEVVRQSALIERTRVAVNNSLIIPQGKSRIPSEQPKDYAEEKISNFYEKMLFGIPYAKTRKPFIVLGAGTVEYRKGIDLFVTTAMEIHRTDPNSEILMVWIGRKIDVEPYKQYADFVLEQMQASGIGARVKLLDETPYLESIYSMVDMFFVSSRLDPLPNVAIDAMMSGKPVISFESATGISEILASSPLTSSCVMPFLSTDAAAKFILSLSKDKEKLKSLGSHVKNIAENVFNMESYVEKLEKAVSDVSQSYNSLKTDESFLLERNDFIEGFYIAPDERCTKEQAVRKFVKYSQGFIFNRKPRPGFNPERYVTDNTIAPIGKNPLVHFAEAGKPNGQWLDKVIYIKDRSTLKIANLKIGVHIHAYYPDMLPDIINRLSENNTTPDLLISVTSETAKKEVESLLKDNYPARLTVRTVPNVGRDIGPFFTEFKDDLITYDVVGHFHTKKSPHVPAESRLVKDWVNFLMENLIGGRFNSADAIIKEFEMSPQLGLVFADDPNLIGWDKNLEFAQELAQRMDIVLKNGYFSFPVGTMFWARPKALEPMFNLDLNWSDYPAEPLPIDGSLLHAMERLLPIVTNKAGYTHSVTYVENARR